MGKLMFFDVDGTLFRREIGVPESTVNAIKEAVDNGHYAYICTGRGGGEMPSEVMALPWHGAVCQCGGYVKVGDNLILDAKVDEKDCPQIFSILRKYKCPFFIENSDYFYYDPDYLPSGFDNIIEGMEKNYPGYSKRIDELNGGVSKMTGYPIDRSLIPKIRQELSPWFYVIDHEEYDYIEIVINGYTKGTGIEKVMEVTGISHEDCIGFGDSHNDIAMLETVGTAVVMGEAPEELKERYQATDGIGEDGLAKAMAKLGLCSTSTYDEEANDDEERVLVGSIQKFSVEDGPGIRTSVFLKGCPLSCKWCHNPELIAPGQQLIQSPNNCIGCGACVEVCPQGAIKMTPDKGIVIDRAKCDCCLECTRACFAEALRPVARNMTVDEIMDEIEKDKGFYDKTGGGLTISGGELLMHTDVVKNLITEAANRGIGVCLDTCAYWGTETIMELAAHDNVTDVLFDVKSVDDQVHREYTGVSNEIILKNLEVMSADPRTASKINARMILVEGVNDSPEIIKATGQMYERLGIKKVTLLPYHSLGISKQRNVGGTQQEFMPPSEERLSEMEEYFKGLGMNVEILGRV